MKTTNSSTSTRTGKIARLPRSIRDQLNQRLDQNAPAKSILPWLNGLAEVKTLLATQFDSRPITKQNLSEWRKGGFRDWAIRQDALQFVQNFENEDDPANPTLSANFTDKLARWLALQYAAATRSLPTDNPRSQWHRLREFCADISRLRRAEFHADLIQLKRDWLAHEKAHAEYTKEQQFTEWAKQRGLLREPRQKGGISKETMNEFETLLGLQDPPPDGSNPGDMTDEEVHKFRVTLATDTFEYDLETAVAVANDAARHDLARRAATQQKSESPAAPPPSPNPNPAPPDLDSAALDAPPTTSVLPLPIGWGEGRGEGSVPLSEVRGEEPTNPTAPSDNPSIQQPTHDRSDPVKASQAQSNQKTGGAALWAPSPSLKEG